MATFSTKNASVVGQRPLASSVGGGVKYQNTATNKITSPVQSYRTPSPVTYTPSQGSVLGASTSQGGGNQGGGGQVSQPQQFNSPPYENSPDQPNIDFDALIAPAIEGLEAAISPLQQGFSDYQASQEAGRVRDIASTKQQIGEQEGLLASKKTQQTQKGESAIDEARRLYSEIGQGIQSRYGGTTGTGAFATELAGSQTLRNIGNIRTQVSQALADADDKLIQIKEIGRIALQEIEDKTKDRIAQAKNDLDMNLADIRRQKGELQSRKAELAMNAMNIYRQQVADVNARNAAFKQQLYNSQLASEQRLKESLARGKQAAESFSVNQLVSGGISTPVLRGNKTGSLQGLGGAPLPSYDENNYQLYNLGNFNPTALDQEEDDNAPLQF